jgi:cytochrome c peroxidase
VLTLCSARASIAQAPIPRADQEPMTPAQPLPAQHPRQVAPGHLLFYNTRLSHDDNRMSPNGFSFA